MNVSRLARSIGLVDSLSRRGSRSFRRPTPPMPRRSVGGSESRSRADRRWRERVGRGTAQFQ